MLRDAQNNKIVFLTLRIKIKISVHSNRYAFYIFVLDPDPVWIYVGEGFCENRDGGNPLSYIGHGYTNSDACLKECENIDRENHCYGAGFDVNNQSCWLYLQNDADDLIENGWVMFRKFNWSEDDILEETSTGPGVECWRLECNIYRIKNTTDIVCVSVEHAYGFIKRTLMHKKSCIGGLFVFCNSAFPIYKIRDFNELKNLLRAICTISATV